MTSSRPWFFVGFVLCALIGACAVTSHADKRKLEAALYAYAGAIRWNDFEGALSFLDPDTRAEKMPTALDRQRAAQLQVTGYHERSTQQVSATEIRQVVEISFINRHTQAERVLIDRQRWRWDTDANRWWLASGLPDFAPRRERP